MYTNKSKILYIALIAACTAFFAAGAYAQDQQKNFDEIEKTQDQIEHMYAQVYAIIDAYPDVEYRYVFDDGKVTDVIVENVPDNRDKKLLEVYLIDLEDLKSDIENLSNRTGVYYVAEQEPRPEDGKEEFFRNLQGMIQYPESAESNGVEGTIFVKFVVNSVGNIDHIYATEDVESPGEWIVQDMKQEAIRAVKATSGDWKPTTVAGVPVSDWVVVPVQFKLESPMFRARIL
jgi:TonB family protein